MKKCFFLILVFLWCPFVHAQENMGEPKKIIEYKENEKINLDELDVDADKNKNTDLSVEEREIKSFDNRILERNDYRDKILESTHYMN
jgi:hypothetical protein